MPTKQATKVAKTIPGCPSDEEIADSVARGVVALKRVWKGGKDWFELIDLPRLDLTDGILCILGQLYGSFALGYKKLGWSHVKCAELGLFYDRPNGLTDEEYEAAFNAFYAEAHECWLGEIAGLLRGDTQ